METSRKRHREYMEWGVGEAQGGAQCKAGGMENGIGSSTMSIHQTCCEYFTYRAHRDVMLRIVVPAVGVAVATALPFVLERGLVAVTRHHHALDHQAIAPIHECLPQRALCHVCMVNHW